ncbi:phospho-2-dehydro-3-deoxyheptonate aldolase [Sphaerisporangium krabiense]|uniref:Phospho-2-dehydro-3-deoxyheptonate aldolase n=1 Tax=Sphaerisporangium krabiense TaxID=763782 RepID=A0A7W9DSE1_9ACTN|nr:3-deoxy-7-phosphoheptulonate synthase [Sphaerisporangium krabiense]MBB5629466.1 3-deoxy-7-phosphoheptulonate synthase [Sphaerisporangium krabiense]GII65684.1 phospho-2-dehydro-3-deoxyheptonate aldolase [Sphaerisporangium krabiense]
MLQDLDTRIDRPTRRATLPRTVALPAPGRLGAEIPLPPAAADRVLAHRAAAGRILDGADDRLLVIVGPCSIHDPVAGLDYARRLADAAAGHDRDLLVVMRGYLEKPRTVLGWKGLVHDPALDGSDDLPTGLRVGRRFLRDVAALGLPLAAEFVDPFLAPYFADLVTYGALGARTVTSQPHRQLASWLPLPVGCKNAVDGDLTTAVEAIRAARAPHVFPGVTEEGTPGVLRGAGNPHAHLVLRGGASGPNYDRESVAGALRRLGEADLPGRVVIDASHGNSGKDHRRQPHVVADIAAQVAGGGRGVAGVMIESFLEEGRQEAPLRYGVSITDACVGFPDTLAALDLLATAARRRRLTGSP